MSVLQLTAIELDTGVNEAGEGFVKVRCHADLNGEAYVAFGQISADEARQQGIYFLEAGEAANTDAGLYTFALAMDPDHPDAARQAAATLVLAVREHRKL